MNWKWIGRRRRELAERLAKLEAEAEAERQRRVLAELTERAEVELGHLPGTIEEKIDILKALDAMPEATRKTASNMFGKANKIATMAFETLGYRGANILRGIGDSQEYKLISGFDARISEVRRSHRGFRAEALREARLAHPEEFAAWQNAG